MVKAIATILLLGCSISEAFTPSSSVSVKSTTTQLKLGYISGPEDGLKHKPFGSPGHFEIIGGKSDAGRSGDHTIDTRKRLEGQGKFFFIAAIICLHIMTFLIVLSRAYAMNKNCFAIIFCLHDNYSLHICHVYWCTPSSNGIYTKISFIYFVNRYTHNFI